MRDSLIMSILNLIWYVLERIHITKRIRLIRSFQSLLFLKLWQTKLISRVVKVLNFALFRRIYITAQQENIKITQTTQITVPKTCFTLTCKFWDFPKKEKKVCLFFSLQDKFLQSDRRTLSQDGFKLDCSCEIFGERKWNFIRQFQVLWQIGISYFLSWHHYFVIGNCKCDKKTFL